MVLPPIDESFDKSFKSETPLIKDASIKGTAISFNELMNIVPKGLIQFEINSFPPSMFVNIKANITPKTIPRIICQ